MHLFSHLFIYLVIYLCVCVCVCVYMHSKNLHVYIQKPDQLDV